MKTQRSRFRLISLFLLCVFLAAVFFCVRQISLLTLPVSVEDDAGELPAPGESLNEPDSGLSENGSGPESSPVIDSPYDTTGL